jgi:hypothetical protein
MLRNAGQVVGATVSGSESIPIRAARPASDAPVIMTAGRAAACPGRSSVVQV